MGAFMVVMAVVRLGFGLVGIALLMGAAISLVSPGVQVGQPGPERGVPPCSQGCNQDPSQNESPGLARHLGTVFRGPNVSVHLQQAVRRFRMATDRPH